MSLTEEDIAIIKELLKPLETRMENMEGKVDVIVKKIDRL